LTPDCPAVGGTGTFLFVNDAARVWVEELGAFVPVEKVTI